MKNRNKYGSAIPAPPHQRPQIKTRNVRILVKPEYQPGCPHNDQRMLSYLTDLATSRLSKNDAVPDSVPGRRYHDQRMLAYFHNMTAPRS